MPSQSELDQCYMQVALEHAKLSKAARAKVGACLVTKHGSIIPAYNGTPRLSDNTCEKSVFDRSLNDYKLVTLDTVIHAERNVLIRCAKEGVSCDGATLYVTLGCCVPCAAMIVQAGIREVIYLNEYRVLDGLLFLQDNGVIVRKINLEELK